MTPQRGFSYRTVQNAALKMRTGIKSDCHISDNLSDEDISRAWRKASMKVFGDSKQFRMPYE